MDTYISLVVGTVLGSLLGSIVTTVYHRLDEIEERLSHLETDLDEIAALYEGQEEESDEEESDEEIVEEEVIEDKQTKITDHFTPATGTGHFTFKRSGNSVKYEDLNAVPTTNSVQSSKYKTMSQIQSGDLTL